MSEKYFVVSESELQDLGLAYGVQWVSVYGEEDV